ncbi:MAG: ABC transporter ATP-binding protein [Microbacteriaceae bacterium]|nr:ABC transporter ATP-binding protein [Microbacteriaceae bacterium]MCL2795342.1 ABC transporter ATP-binding protein [Microbacteriaceae bacterium]
MPDGPVLETRGLRKRFGDLVAVDGIDLQIAPGSVHGLLGRNGAGKTTFMRMVLGLLAPDAGAVEVLGRPAAPGDVEARRAVSGFVEEPRFYPYLSARRNLELLSRLDGSAVGATPDEALELVDLAARARDKVGNFSTGMRQRLGIAAALLRSARLVLLDEPTIGLDPANARAVRDLVRELAGRGIALLLSSHNMPEVAEVCDRLTIVHRGRAVWEGDQAALHAAAPDPAYLVWTSDDERASRLAAEHGLAVTAPVRSAARVVTIQGDDAARDAFVLELARSGVAVRRLEPDVSPLEALFTSLTGAPAGDAADAPAAEDADDAEDLEQEDAA